MITIKQVEAVFWVSRLGSFEAAAAHLNTTQSAVSKRIQDLETRYGQPLFDRSRRTAKLTALGEEIAMLATSLLNQRDVILQRLESPENLYRKLRLGVTELTALTWLPDLVHGIRSAYPLVEIIPEVNVSPVLFDRLASNSLDLIIVPDIFQDNRFPAQMLAPVENAWMCAPSLVGNQTRLTLEDLATRTLVVQGGQSGMGRAYGQWFKSQGVDITRSITCNNLLAQIGLAASGLATAYLPRACVAQMLSNNLLHVLDVTPALPALNYKAIHRSLEDDPFMSSVLAVTRQTCDFSRFIMQ